jgi:hypothetical protein
MKKAELLDWLRDRLQANRSLAIEIRGSLQAVPVITILVERSAQ